MMVDGYDIIGDIHGYARALEALLQKLGYHKRDGAYQYRDQRRPRQVVFLGDVLDRGPHIREAVQIVRAMIERGSAQMIMGNHEYNALCYCTPAPEDSDRHYLREHTPRHTHAIQQTLDQYAAYPEEWRETLNWMATLPVFLEFEQFRVVHACWDQRLIDRFYEQGHSPVISRQFLFDSADYRQFAGRFISRLTQGVGLMLPEGRVIRGSHGFERRSFRARFWEAQPQTLGDVEFQPDRLPADIAAMSLTDKQRDHIGYYGVEQKPLFIGHYWMAGEPKPLRSNIACLDYSAVKQGRLAAYRMNGEARLQAKNFVWVDGIKA